MPIVTFHVGGELSAEQSKRLLCEATAIYSDVLDAPVDRVRAFINRYAASDVAVGGNVLAEGECAIYFEFIVMEGRPLAQQAELMLLFTELAAEITGVSEKVIRGRCVTVPPQQWGIAGRMATEVRASEIAQRAQQQQ